MIRSFLAVLAAVLMMSSPAAAEKIGGVELSETLSEGGSRLVLNGAGIRKKAFLKLYVGGLYLKEKQQDAARNLGPDRLEAIWISQKFDQFGDLALCVLLTGDVVEAHRRPFWPSRLRAKL